MPRAAGVSRAIVPLAMNASTAPDPWSYRQRGRKHNRDDHAAPFAQCLLCWPGAALCGVCGHVLVNSKHGHAVVINGTSYMREQKPCDAFTEERAGRVDDEGRPRCGCVVGSRPPTVRILETDRELPMRWRGKTVAANTAHTVRGWRTWERPSALLVNGVQVESPALQRSTSGLRELDAGSLECPWPCRGLLAEDAHGHVYCLSCGERFTC